MVEHRIELIVGEHLGVGLGLFIILGDDVGNLLGGHAEIGGDLLNAILNKTHL